MAAIGVDGPPMTSVRLTVQARDADAAAALRGTWLKAVSPLVRQKGDSSTQPVWQPQLQGDRLVLNLGKSQIDMLFAALSPSVEKFRQRSWREQTSNHLKQMAIAMHNYHDVHGTFPPVGSRSPEGKLLLSWRVLILPFIEQNSLYEQFHLNEPWDSPHNRQLIEKMPECYRCPASNLLPAEGLSTYNVPMGAETIFPSDRALSFREIKDGTSSTILAMEVDDKHAAIWTKPEGYPLDLARPAEGLGGHFEGGFLAAMADCSVRFLSEKVKPEILRAMFTAPRGPESLGPVARL